jgi:hypothetical protein
MKNTVALLFAASTLFLAGCCTTHQVSQRWEYKIISSNPIDSKGLNLERQQQDLNDWGKEGWIFVAKDGSLFYLKRPVR